jgi:hypothetical protein
MSRGVLEILIALVAIGGCLATVTYAATRHEPADGAERIAGWARATAGARGRAPKAPAARPPRPKITAHPATETTSARARFAFADRQPGVRFACRLDRRKWQGCSSPTIVRVAVGRHSFSVRALNRRGGRSPVARFRWTRLEPMDFSIAPDLSSIGALYPGAPPVALPLTVSNPNSVPIQVTDLRVSVATDPAGCPSVDNLLLGPESVSSAKPLTVPARGSIRLPSGGVAPPTIQLRDLPVNQDACKNARFPLEFSGEARG